MQKDIEYFRSSKRYILAATAVFIGSFFAGILISANYPDASGNVLKLLKESFGNITALDPFGMMIEIFKNNLRNSFAALILGIGFGIIPFMFASINGLVLGILVEFFLKAKGVPFVIAAILPHGIIELPVILMSVGIGLRLGHAAYRSVLGLRTMKDFLDELKQGIFFYARIIAPLLLLAALVESYITPLIISRIL